MPPCMVSSSLACPRTASSLGLPPHLPGTQAGKRQPFGAPMMTEQGDVEAEQARRRELSTMYTSPPMACVDEARPDGCPVDRRPRRTAAIMSSRTQQPCWPTRPKSAKGAGRAHFSGWPRMVGCTRALLGPSDQGKPLEVGRFLKHGSLAQSRPPNAKRCPL